MGAEWRSAFVDEVREHHGDVAARAAVAVMAGVDDRGLKLVERAGHRTKGMGFMVVVPGIAWEPTPVASSGKPGTIGWELPNLRRGNPFKIEQKEFEFRERLGTVPGMDPSYPHYPKVKYTALAADYGVGRLLEVLDWTVATNATTRCLPTRRLRRLPHWSRVAPSP